MFDDLIPGAKPAAGKPQGAGMFDDLVPPPTGFVRTQADRALALGQGIAGGVKSLVDVAGADTRASKALGALNEGMEDLYSPARKAEKRQRQQAIEQADASGSTLDQVTTRLGGFAEAPAQTLLQGIGSMVPTLAAAYATKGRSAAAALPIGAAQGVGEVKGQNYDAVKAEALARGRTPEQAEALAVRASEYSRQNAPQLALAAGLGALAGSSGVEGAVSRLAGGGQAAGGIASRVARGAVAEALPEGAQGAQGQLAQNVALTQAGIPTDTWQGVLGTGVHDAAVGTVLGGAAALPRGRAPTAGQQPNTSAADPAANPAADPAMLPGAPAPTAVQPPPADAGIGAAAQVRAQMLPDTGPLSAAINAGLEGEARKIEAAIGITRGRGAATLPVGEVTEGIGSGITDFTDFTLPPPAMEASEIDMARAAQLAAVPGELQTEALPVGQVVEAPIETVDTSGLEMQPAPRAPRKRSGDAVDIPAMDIDRAGRIAVAKYISEVRRTNTPAARAFMQDYIAGRITQADVLRIVRPQAEASVEDRLAAAAAQAPATAPGQDGLLLASDGRPLTGRGAAASAPTPGQAAAGGIIQPAGGYSTRPRQAAATAAAQPTETAAPTAPMQQMARTAQPGLAVGDTFTDRGATWTVADVADQAVTATDGKGTTRRIAVGSKGYQQAVQGLQQVQPQSAGDARAPAAANALPAAEAVAGNSVAQAQSAGEIGGNGVQRAVTRPATAPSNPEVAGPASQPEASATASAAAPVSTQAPAQAGETVAAAPDMVRVPTVFGSNTYVRRADIEGDENGLVRAYTADGKSNGLIARGNLDLTGEKRRAAATADANNPLFNVITRKGGQAFQTAASAQRELNARGMADTHEVTPAASIRDGLPGYVIRRKAPAAASPQSAATTEGARDGQEEGLQGRRQEALTQPNPEQRPAPPVAESQAPAPSEPGDGGVAPTQESGAPATPSPPRDIPRLRKLLNSLTALRDCVAA